MAAADRDAVVGGVDRPDPDFGGGAGFPVVVVVVVVDELDGDDVPAEDLGFGVVVGVVDFGRVVVVVVAADFDVDPVEPEDFIVVVVVVGAFGLDGFDPAGFDPGGFDVVVVTGARGFGGVPREDSVVEVVAAAGTLGSSRHLSFSQRDRDRYGLQSAVAALVFVTA